MGAFKWELDAEKAIHAEITKVNNNEFLPSDLQISKKDFTIEYHEVK